MRRSTALALVFFSACFNPQDSGLDTDASTSTATDSMTGPTVSGTSATGPSTTSPSTTDPTTGDPTTGDPTTDSTTTDSTTSGGSTGQTELGPQIVMSTPADGDMQAGLTGYLLLYFDRVVSLADATGHILVSQDGSTPAPVSPQPCPPDNDPTCIAALFPASFTDMQTGLLPGNTAHQIIVEADFPDPDGVTNTMDQTVDFTTFQFDSNVFDDSGAITELGGMAFDPVGSDLYLAGDDPGSNLCVVRQIPVTGTNLGSATTVVDGASTGSGNCYGLDYDEGRLLLAMSYNERVRVYDDLSNLGSFFDLLDPGLAAPHATLDEVWSAAYIQNRYFTGYGTFYGGSTGQGYAILQRDNVGTWSIFNDGTNLWDQGTDDVVLTAANVGGTDFLFAHAGSALYKFRVSDGVMMGQIDDLDSFSVHLFVDDFGRLYYGNSGGLTVYDADDLSLVTQRSGIDASRFAVAAQMDNAAVFLGSYRDPAVIGLTTIAF